MGSNDVYRLGAVHGLRLVRAGELSVSCPHGGSPSLSEGSSPPIGERGQVEWGRGWEGAWLALGHLASGGISMAGTDTFPVESEITRSTQNTPKQG